MERIIRRICVGWLLSIALLCAAQDKGSPFAGCWEGTLVTGQANLRLSLELRQENGAWSGAVANLVQPDQSYAVADVKITGKDVTFAVPDAPAQQSFEGTLDPKAGEIHGDWFQGGQSVPCHFRPARAADEGAAALYGNWLGTLSVQGMEMRLVLHVKPAACGLIAVTMDSVDQGANNLPATAADFRSGTFTFALDYIRASFTGAPDPDGKRIAGTFTQGAPFPFVLDKLEGEFSLNRPQEPKPPFPYHEEEVTLTSRSKAKDGKNVVLAGTLTLPEGDGPFPAVMLLTGSGAQNRNEALMGHKPFLVIADHLTRAGIAVLRMDDRGVGGSTGSVYETTLAENADDALVGVDWLRKHAKVDPARVGLVGHSEGGWMAPLAASKSPDVAFIVMLAGPGVSGEEILYAQSERALVGMGADKDIVRLTLDSLHVIYGVAKSAKNPGRIAADAERALEKWEKKLSKADKARLEAFEKSAPGGSDTENLKLLATVWFRDILAYDPRPVLKQVRCPVLALIGEKDFQVPADQNIPVLREILGANPHTVVEEMPGLNHLFQTCDTGMLNEYARIEETFNAAVLDKMTTWILAAPAAPTAVERASRQVSGSGVTWEQTTGSAPVQEKSPCPAAQDSGYGRTMEHPVKVGGVDRGPSREVEFLRALRGPAGEGIHFFRMGSTYHAASDTMLDIYQLSWEGQREPEVLYLDMYHWETPLVPTGFTCSGPIPLKAP